ncbi:AMP-dependent synthetase [Aquabacterium sp. NJ1]|uniref:AMP-dependent synthetase/ligase n=1 Tax=Aquabacterium sp. NJ1 TaxID=1538295 RepID=UPI00052C5A6C|nr:long-chain fatty acid--CoA ligase [Aquabacterium sp. NJ1]KGM41705.1 AMP-dependent synthetase [Aquabacterium sp. NJ1]
MTTNSAAFPLAPGLDSVQTLAALLTWRVALTPDAEAYRYHDDAAARWVSLSWRALEDKVQGFDAALRRLALPRGARVAILLPNGVNAVCVDQAALANACVPVPMHALDNPASIAYILSDSDAALLVAQSVEQWQAIVDTGVPLPSLQQVVLASGEAPPAGVSSNPVPVCSLETWLSSGMAQQASPHEKQVPNADDLAALVYTSGTTGKPKGVMLTHGNVLSNVKAVLQRVAPQANDVFLSFLPLSHTFERTAGYYLPIAAGSCVAFARSTSLLAEDMLLVRPTILISVPRIYERVFAGVQAMLAGSPLKHGLFAWAQNVGWRRFCRAQGLPVEHTAWTWLDPLLWPLLNALAAQPLLARFGGRLRVAVSGGAPLSPAIAHAFLGLGLPIVQGYGMTESAPIVSVNTPEDNDPATVGRALAGVEVQIGENRELLVRGPNVMRGYWKREEDTHKAITEGWLHTGDQAAIEQGRVRILGRVKEIIVTSTGEKIAPADLELAITADALFEQAYVFGDNRPFIACVVVLSRSEWRRLAGGLQLDPDKAESLQSSLARETVVQRVRDLTRSFPHYAQPRAVVLTLEPWTVENTLMTPTLKLKRNNLAAHFAAEISQLYQR